MALPKDYTTPQEPSNYMKLEEGANTFRVLSDIIVGEEYWIDENGTRKPKRVKTVDELPEAVKKATDREKAAKHFWAMVVYKSATKEILILELTQKSIMKLLEALEKDEENWGDLKNYSVTITKTKTGSNKFDVEYSVRPLPPKPLDKAIKKLYEDMQIDLTALYRNEDPFAEPSAEALADAAEEAGI